MTTWRKGLISLSSSRTSLDPHGIYYMYLRKSRADLEAEKEGHFETLRKHEEILTDLASRYGIKVAKVYRELVSGSTIADRPEVRKLLEEVRSGVVDGVLVTEVSRLARGRTIDQGTVAEAFRESGTLIVTPSKIYDPMDDADESFFDFELFLARQEYKVITKRMKAGRRRAQMDGYFVGSRPPMGYRSEHRILVPDENASLIKGILEGYADGTVSIKAAIRMIKAATGKEMPNTSVRYMLQNPAYCGMAHYDVAMHHPTTPADRQRIEGKTVPARWTGLISKETYDRIQARLDSQPKSREDYSLKNPLSGIIRCAECGRGLTYRRNMSYNGDKSKCYPNRHPVLVHPRATYHGEAVTCKCYSAHLDDVMSDIAEALEKELEEVTVTEGSAPQEDIQPLRKALKKAQDAKDSLYDKLDTGIYTVEEYKARRDRWQSEIDRLGGEIRQAEEADAAASDREAVTMSTRQALEAIRDPESKPEDINAFLSVIIKRIDYSRPDRSKPYKLKIIFR